MALKRGYIVELDEWSFELKTDGQYGTVYCDLPSLYTPKKDARNEFIPFTKAYRMYDQFEYLIEGGNAFGKKTPKRGSVKFVEHLDSLHEIGRVIKRDENNYQYAFITCSKGEVFVTASVAMCSVGQFQVKKGERSLKDILPMNSYVEFEAVKSPPQHKADYKAMTIKPCKKQDYDAWVMSKKKWAADLSSSALVELPRMGTQPAAAAGASSSSHPTQGKCIYMYSGETRMLVQSLPTNGRDVMAVREELMKAMRELRCDLLSANVRLAQGQAGQATAAVTFKSVPHAERCFALCYEKDMPPNDRMYWVLDVSMWGQQRPVVLSTVTDSSAAAASSAVGPRHMQTETPPAAAAVIPVADVAASIPTEQDSAVCPFLNRGLTSCFIKNIPTANTSDDNSQRVVSEFVAAIKALGIRPSSVDVRQSARTSHLGLAYAYVNFDCTQAADATFKLCYKTRMPPDWQQCWVLGARMWDSQTRLVVDLIRPKSQSPPEPPPGLPQPTAASLPPPTLFRAPEPKVAPPPPPAAQLASNACNNRFQALNSSSSSASSAAAAAAAPPTDQSSLNVSQAESYATATSSTHTNRSGNELDYDAQLAKALALSLEEAKAAEQVTNQVFTPTPPDQPSSSRASSAANGSATGSAVPETEPPTSYCIPQQQQQPVRPTSAAAVCPQPVVQSTCNLNTAEWARALTFTQVLHHSMYPYSDARRPLEHIMSSLNIDSYSVSSD